VSVFAALICAGAYIAIPLPGNPVPIVIQNLLIVLAGLLLGPRAGPEAVALFLAVGALGAPVFAGGSGGGLAHFAGPRGGYLVGYPAAAFVAGIVARPLAPARKPGMARVAMASALGFLSVYVFGVARLSFLPNTTVLKALAIGFFPFVAWDAIKAVIAALVAYGLIPFVRSLIGLKAKKEKP